MGHLFEVAGRGWRASFQRSAADGAGALANRGALPCHDLGGSAAGLQRVLVPLPPGEGLWIAVTVQGGCEVAGCTRGGAALRSVPVAEPYKGWALVAVDAIRTAEGLRTINAVALRLACTQAMLTHDHLNDHLTLTMTDEGGCAIGRLGVVLGTPALYELLSGMPAPPLTSPGDAYGGWRLP